MERRKKSRMKTVTVRLDQRTLAKARAKAAERNMTLSRYISEALSREAGHDAESQPYPKRAELYRGFEAYENIIMLDDGTAAQARSEAAGRNMSLSRYIGEVLREHARGNGAYERAMQRFLSHQPIPLKGPGERFASREEVHDRAAQRREEAHTKHKGKR